jgi:hypothetical protein
MGILPVRERLVENGARSQIFPIIQNRKSTIENRYGR